MVAGTEWARREVERRRCELFDELVRLEDVPRLFEFLECEGGTVNHVLSSTRFQRGDGDTPMERLTPLGRRLLDYVEAKSKGGE